MEFKDKEGNNIEFYPDINKLESVTNIEVAAGINKFGKVVFPKCLLVDNNPRIKSDFIHFTDHSNSNNPNSVHFIDQFEDFFEFEINEKRFDNLLICNPYGLGFKSKDSALKILSKVDQLLLNGGTFTVLSHSSNPWGKYHNAQKYFKDLEEYFSDTFALGSLKPLVKGEGIIEGHTFKRTCLLEDTEPNQIYHFKKY